MEWCSLCKCRNEEISVYPCGHAFTKCCVDKFLNFTLDCPICIEPKSVFFPVENIKVICLFD